MSGGRDVFRREHTENTLVDGIRLGAANSADTGPYDDPSASGDLADDGVTFGAFGQNQSTEITATVFGASSPVLDKR